MVRKLIMSGLAVIVAAAVVTPVYAYRSDDDDTAGTVTQTVEDNGSNTQETAEDATDDSTNRLRELRKAQREQIEQRKKELRAEFEQKREDRKVKLEGRRLAQCQNREDNINSLIDRSVTIGQERLARIQRFEEGVKAFYVKQSLQSERYDEAVAQVDQKEAAAVAALDVVADQKFECSEVDGEKPSDAIRLHHKAKRAALDEYRASVKQLLTVVKEAFAESKADSGAEN